MNISPNLLKPIFLLLALGLASCGGGSGTSSNANLNTADGAYTGPPAKTDDVRNFQQHFWTFLKEDNRCGQCHGDGQEPTFVNPDDINKAYSKAIKYAKLQDPASSTFVTKVGGGHQCWLSSLNACATTIEQMISNWATASNIASARLIQLTAPDHRDPGDAKSFPPDADTEGTNGASFENTVYPLLVGTTPVIANGNCQNCHTETGPLLPQAPFFASTDVDSAYEAAKSKMNIDVPANSRFVERLEQLHNCWSDCGDDAVDMTAVIDLFAQGIAETEVDPDALLASKALSLGDGIIASGGNRHESNLVALWEFKTGSMGIAYDTSGIDPAVDLALMGSVEWLETYGLNFTGGRAQALTFDSVKLHTFIQSTGQYSVETWVMPANVVQEDANIISYSVGDTARNFTLGQTLYNYEFYNRIAEPQPGFDIANGEPMFNSGENDVEFAQANLQHVVVNYDRFDGREMYVNGVKVDVDEPVSGNTSINNVWEDSLATLVLGNETSGNRPWQGQVRLLAIHNRTLTNAQVQQNFDVGVGAKFFLLFYVGHRIGIPESYVMFEVSQYDNYSYLFNKPTFINLDAAWDPVPVDIKGLRIGINGKEALAGQAFANIDVTIDGSYDPQFGQVLSSIGTIITLEKGADSDEFFLTFETIGPQSRTYTEATPTVPGDSPDPAEQVESDIGVRTFEEINATIATITGVPVTDPVVEAVYTDYLQQLPTVEAIDAFLPSHQMAIAQLALTYCSQLVETNPGFFTDFVFAQNAQDAFGAEAPVPPTPAQQANRSLIIDPLLTAVMNIDPFDPTNNLTSQPNVAPNETEISDLLGAGASQNLDTGVNLVAYDSLITQLINTCTPVPPAACTPENTQARTAQIVKAVCAAAAGGAVMVVQ